MASPHHAISSRVALQGGSALNHANNRLESRPQSGNGALGTPNPIRATAGKASSMFASDQVVTIPESTREQALTLHSSSTTSTPKFNFVTEETKQSPQLTRIQEQAIRRRQEFNRRIHYLELSIASTTAQLAHERMNRDRDLQEASQNGIYKPLEDCVEHITLERDRLLFSTPHSPKGNLDTCSSAHPQQVRHENRDSSLNWMSLESRLSQLDAQATHWIQVRFEDSKRETLDQVGERLEQDLVPDLKLETSKADKRESSMFRNLEELAGTGTRRWLEERATRAAAIEMAAKKMLSLEGFDAMGQADTFLSAVRELRSQLAIEREERVKMDRMLIQQIQRTKEALESALLEAVGETSTDLVIASHSTP